MFGISFTEFLLIGVVALLVFGPDKLPEVVRWVGRISGQLRKTSDSLKRELYSAVYQPTQNELANAKGEMHRLKSEFFNSTQLDPSCPDTIAKRAVTLKASQETVLPKSSQDSQGGSDSEPPSTSANAPAKSPVVDIPLPTALSSATSPALSRSSEKLP